MFGNLLVGFNQPPLDEQSNSPGSLLVKNTEPELSGFVVSKAHLSV